MYRNGRVIDDPWIIVRACVERRDYVKKFLIPSLLEQGMPQDHVLIWQDTDRVGNLQAFLNMMTWIKDNMDRDTNIWLLQDDVIISSTFVKTICSRKVMKFKGIINGYCCQVWNEDNYEKTGERINLLKWFSFPCERIPVSYIEKFLEWFELSVKRDDELGDQYRFWANHGKFDDSFWMDYLYQCHPIDKCWNYGTVVNGVPQGGLVEHVDYLIGGSLINPRQGDVRRLNYYWNEPELVEKLKVELEKAGMLQERIIKENEDIKIARQDGTSEDID